QPATIPYFRRAGTRPALRRAFRPTRGIPNAPPVGVLSPSPRMRRFRGDRGVVGRAIPINGESHEIIGVMPAGFTPVYIPDASMWRPLRLRRDNPSRNSAVFHTFGRLREGVTIDQARARLAVVAGQLQQAHPDSDSGKG